MTDPTLLFALLHQAEIGMKIYLTDTESIYVYEVFRHEIIDPHEVEVIDDQDQSMLTLITCDFSAQWRLATQAKLVETIPFAEANDIVTYFQR